MIRFGSLFLLIFFASFVNAVIAQQSEPIQFDQLQSQQIQSQQNQSQITQSERDQSQEAKSLQTPSQQARQSTQQLRQDHFYNVDSERRIEGKIREIIFEPRYEDRLPFLIIVLEEKKTGEVYKVEVSPVWFFNYDLHQGESIGVIGSFYTKDNENFIIARELQAGGEVFRLRDNRGFPNWRGGPMKGKIRHRGR